MGKNGLDAVDTGADKTDSLVESGQGPFDAPGERRDSRQARTFHRLSAADGVLWSIGAKDVLAFDGKAWTRID